MSHRMAEVHKKVRLAHEERAKRSSQRQLEELDFRLGRGVGAVKERARLTRLVGAEQEAARAQSKGKKARVKKSA